MQRPELARGVPPAGGELVEFRELRRVDVRFVRHKQKAPPKRGFSRVVERSGLLRADDLDLHAAGLLASFLRLARRPGLLLALAFRVDAVRLYALRYQVGLDRLGAAYGQLLVVR